VGYVVVGIDIGSSKVCTLVGSVNNGHQLDIIGKGIASCNGVKKGVIVDVERTAASIAASVEQAQTSADAKICSAYVNLAGMHVDILKCKGSLEIAGKGREITSGDVEMVLHSAEEEAELQEGMDIIDVIPVRYVLDGYDEIQDPVGMIGTRLEVEADIVIGKVAAVKNILKSLNIAGLKTDGIVLEAFALAEMQLSSEEKKNGVLLVDVGGGITNITAIKNDRLLLFDSIPVGGDHITSDISIGLQTSISEAEKIKRQYELALTTLIDNDQNLFVNDIKEKVKKTVKVSEVVEIIEARVYEIFSLCGELLDKKGLQQGFDAGVVLTGSGISHLDGNKQIAGEVFELPVRVAGIPSGELADLRREFITAAGIVKYVSGSTKNEGVGSEIIPYTTNKATPSENGILKKISNIIRELF
jgi:cell division protein FtsA